MPTTLALPDVTASIQALTAWLAHPATKERMQAAVLEAVAEVERYILSNTSLRVPRQRAERQDGFRLWLDAFAAHGFEHWLNSYKHQLAQEIQGEALLALPEVFAGLRNRELIRETVETLLWPEMEPLLRDRAEELLLTYAVRGIALTWASRNLGDGLLVGLPVGLQEKQKTRWLVPLHLRSTQAFVDYIELDPEGEVLSDVGALRAVTETAA